MTECLNTLPLTSMLYAGFDVRLNNNKRSIILRSTSDIKKYFNKTIFSLNIQSTFFQKIHLKILSISAHIFIYCKLKAFFRLFIYYFEQNIMASNGNRVHYIAFTVKRCPTTL